MIINFLVEGDIMINKDIYNWLFATLDEIIDCKYKTNVEDEKNVDNKRKRSVKTFNDFRESGRNHTK